MCSRALRAQQGGRDGASHTEAQGSKLKTIASSASPTATKPVTQCDFSNGSVKSGSPPSRAVSCRCAHAKQQAAHVRCPHDAGLSSSSYGALPLASLQTSRHFQMRQYIPLPRPFSKVYAPKCDVICRNEIAVGEATAVLLEAVVPLPCAPRCSLPPSSAINIPLWAVPAVTPRDICHVVNVAARSCYSTQ